MVIRKKERGGKKGKLEAMVISVTDILYSYLVYMRFLNL